MWIALNDAFLSVVDKAKDKSFLVVRARKQGDIEAVFPDAAVQIGGGTDYKYRATIPRARVAQAIADRITNISYSNFKNSVKDRARHDAYMQVWLALMALQGN